MAAINPSLSSISPHGPTNLIPEVPLMSPDSLISATTPRVLASVKETSTWQALLSGPRIDTLEIVVKIVFYNHIFWRYICLLHYVFNINIKKQLKP